MTLVHVLNGSNARKRLSRFVKNAFAVQAPSQRQFWVERLEERYLLSANSQSSFADLFSTGPMVGSQTAAAMPADNASIPDSDLVMRTSAPPPPRTEQALASNSLLQIAPFPLEQTFLLHSLPGATNATLSWTSRHGVAPNRKNRDRALHS